MWAFSDESARSGGEMLLAVVLIDPTDLIAARVGLRGLLMAGQRRVHTSDESAPPRPILLDTVARTTGLSAVRVALPPCLRCSPGRGSPAAARNRLRGARWSGSRRLDS